MEQETIQKITRVYNNVQEFVEAYAEWDRSYNARAFRSDACDPTRFTHWLCCPRHLLLNAEKDMIENWAVYYGGRFGISEQYSGYRLTRNWLAELAKISGCVLPEELQ